MRARGKVWPTGGDEPAQWMIDKTDATFAIAKRNQVFAQQTHALRLPIHAQVRRRQKRHPVKPHELAHGRAGAYAHEGFIVFVRKHRYLRIVVLPNW